MHIAQMELVNGRLVEVKSRDLSQLWVAACPHRIFDMNHYRANGACKCSDPYERVMRKWGYRWSAKKGMWI